MSGTARHVEIVTAALKKIGRLSPAGEMLRIDSLTLIDFIVELEDGSGLRIDVAELDGDTFDSIASVAALLASVESAARQ